MADVERREYASEPDERWVTASDGAVLRYRVWPAKLPDREGRERGSLLLFNGIMSHSLWFAPLAATVTAAGWRMIGADRRGSGPNTTGRGDAPSASQLVDDAVRIAAGEGFMAEHPGVVVGWCWGAALAISVCAALQPRPPGLVLVTPGLRPSTAVTDALARAVAGATSDEPSAATIPTPIAAEMFTHGPALDGFIRRDAQRVMTMSPRLVTVSRQLASVAVPRLRRLCAHGLSLRVVLASDDAATDNAATRVLLRPVPQERLSVRELQGAHGLQFEQPDALARELLEFAASVSSS